MPSSALLAQAWRDTFWIVSSFVLWMKFEMSNRSSKQQKESLFAEFPEKEQSSRCGLALQCLRLVCQPRRVVTVVNTQPAAV